MTHPSNEPQNDQSYLEMFDASHRYDKLEQATTVEMNNDYRKEGSNNCLKQRSVEDDESLKSLKLANYGWDENLYESPQLYEETYHNIPETVIVQQRHNTDKQGVVHLSRCKLVLCVVTFGVLIVTIVALTVCSAYWISRSSGPVSEDSTSITSKSASSSPSLTTDLTEGKHRREYIRQMAVDAWKVYRAHAWGDGTVRPLSRSPGDYIGFGRGSGLTIVNSLATLWVLGLNDQFEEARAWVETKLDLAQLHGNVRVFDVNSHYVGGLLSAYALTRDRMFLTKARAIADLVAPAFATDTGVPYESINLNTGKTTEPNPWFSHVVGNQAEMMYLSDLTSDDRYRNRTLRVRQIVKWMDKPRGLLYDKVSVVDKTWSSPWANLLEFTREQYIGSLNTYIQSNQMDSQALRLYQQAVDGADQMQLFHRPSTSQLIYARNYNKDDGTYFNRMNCDACYLGAMLARGAVAMEQTVKNETNGSNEGLRDEGRRRIVRHWELAEWITETCHFASTVTATRLPPFGFYHNGTHEVASLDARYWPSPELAESYLVLWRLTGREKYREYAWNYAQALGQNCRAGNGFADISDVHRTPPPLHDNQNPLLLSGTLKFLYLTFVDDAKHPQNLPLDQWVFTSRGHPLPIKGTNSAYPN